MSNLSRYIRMLWIRIWRQPFARRLKGTIKPTGDLIAHKLPSNLKIAVRDDVEVKEGFETHSKGGGIESVRIVRSDGQIVSSDLDDSGSIDYSVEGKSPQGEGGTIEVCDRLVDRLNEDGASWGAPIDLTNIEVDRSAGIDCRAIDCEKILSIQVTRAEISIWGRLSVKGKISQSSDMKLIIDAMWHVIATKSNPVPIRDREDIVLALNASEAPHFAFENVVNTFRQIHGTSTASLGYRMIWIVGPNERLTSRLDVQLDEG